MTYYECSYCKENIEAPQDVPTQMIGEWRKEKYLYFCLQQMFIEPWSNG